LTFHRAVKGVSKNETLEVIRTEAKSIVTRNDRGDELAITAKQARAFDVLERREIEVATGDRLLLTGNRRDPTFRATNGELVTVSRVRAGGRIRLEDGREMPSNYRQFAYGYAVTAHRSQGKSVDSVIVSGDGMRKELFYVAASRGKRSVQVITSDKEQLRESVARSTARKSASELARKARPGLHQGPWRGVSAARELANHAARRERASTLIQLPQPSVTKQIRMERTREHSFDR
jgi:ATP-dependent exoDNAse (exonuclease V) alpha subunit